MFGMDETGIFADPANPCALGEIAFKDGTGIRVPAIPYRTSNLLLDKLDKFFHASRKNIVIIVALGIGSNFACNFSLTLSFGHPSPAGRGVGRCQHKNGLALRHNFTRVGAAGPGTICRQIRHGAMMVLGKPVFECGEMRGWVWSRHASQDESQLS